MNHLELLKTLEWQLGQGILESELTDQDLWVRVAPPNWREIARIARDEAGCSYFTFISAVDWLVNPELDGEKTFAPPSPAAPEEGPEEAESANIPTVITEGPARKAGGTSRFQIMGRLYNVEAGLGVTFIADLGDDLAVPSWTSIFSGANWHERETWEMFGITFEGHPDLRHIYLPAEFEGHPLRKDFALLAREVRPWPGLVDMEEMP